MSEKLIISKLNGHDKEGKVGKVYFKAGDHVSAGEILFTIESGKGSLKYKSEYTGTIEALTVEAGSIVTKGQEVGLIDGKREVKQAKAYSFGLSKPAKKDIHAEVLIIGGGPGGYVAALRSAQLGKKVVLIEEDKLGGTCLNYGCIPTKALSHSTKVLNHIRQGHEYGFTVHDFDVNIKKMMERKDQVVETLVSGVDHLMASNDIEVYTGRGQVVSKDLIAVKNKSLDLSVTFDHLIIAVGSEPGYIPIEGHDLKSVMTSRHALAMEDVPDSMVIIGGGVIGMEFAFIFNALGTEVHVVEYMPEILGLLDQDVVDVIRESAEDKGIKIHRGARASRIIETLNKKVITEFEIGDQTYRVASERVMMAVGRKPRLDSLDLQKLGVDLNDNNNGILVDDFMKTTNDKVYAIGDVTNIMQLAHVASHQGMVAAEHISGLSHKMDYEKVPSAIFTQPEVGHVGITEKIALERGINYKASKFYFAANGKSVAMNETEGFVKLIYDLDRQVLIGGVIVGGHGTDMIATVTNMVDQGVSLQEAASVIYAHPTSAEAIHEALLGLEDRSLHGL